jgi:hypothetical protein
MQKSQRHPRVVRIASVDVGDPIAVEEDFDRRFEAGQCQLPFERRHGAAEQQPQARAGQRQGSNRQ